MQQPSSGSSASPDNTDNVTQAVVSIDIDADLDHVWKALTSDDGLAGWMGEGSSMGAEPGDDLSFADVVTGAPKRGRVNKIEKHSHVHYSWWPDADDQNRSDVSITLEPLESGTRVVVVESQPLAVQASVSGPAQAAAVPMATWSWRCALLSLATQLIVVPTLARLA